MSFGGEVLLDVNQSSIKATGSARFLKRLLRRPIGVAALAVLIVFYAIGILAPVIAPYEFNDTDLQHPFEGPSSDHLLGTDRLGRDVLARLIWSAQTTVIVSVATMVAGGLILGVTLGLLAGYRGGGIDSLIMRAGDAFHSVPTLFLLLIINASLKDRIDGWFGRVDDFLGTDWLSSTGASSYFLVFGALSIFGWVGIARLVRSQVLSLRESPYVVAARAAGASTTRILLVHLLPNVSNLLIVAITLSLGATALAEVGLTFLGIGIQFPHPSFGRMIADYAGPTNVRSHFNLILFPSIAVVLLALSFNLLGDVLTDVLSPRRR